MMQKQRTFLSLALAYLCICPFSFAGNPKPMGSIVVAAKYPNGSVGGLTFISDDKFVLTEVDNDPKTNQFDFTNGFLEIRAFKILPIGIQPDWKFFLPRHTNFGWPVLFLPEGFLVHDGHDILRFNANRELIKKRSVESVCGLQLTKNAILSVLMFPASEKTSILVIDENYSERHPQNSWIFRQTWRPKTDFCWFSNETLRLLARGGTHPLEGHDVKPEEYLQSRDRILITPRGPLSADIECPRRYGEQKIMRLKQGGGWAVECQWGEIEIEREGRTATKKLEKNWPDLKFVSTSARAPLLAVGQTKNFYGFMGADDGTQTEFEVFDYVDLTTKFLFKFPRNQGAYSTLAVSPNGRYVALMEGDRVNIFRLP